MGGRFDLPFCDLVVVLLLDISVSQSGAPSVSQPAVRTRVCGIAKDLASWQGQMVGKVWEKPKSYWTTALEAESI